MLEGGMGRTRDCIEIMKGEGFVGLVVRRDFD